MEPLCHAYILHRRLFRDTSLIVDFFTFEQGCISAVAKGGRSSKSKLRGALQFFSPLLISFYGRSELLGLKSIESNGCINILEGKYLLSMLYVNELLTKLLHKADAQPRIFLAYQQLIEQFVLQKNIEECLRIFEMQLLEELGYGFNFLVDDANAYYCFSLEEGVKRAEQSGRNVYSGKILHKLHQKDFSDQEALSTAKKLFRHLFNELLQHKTINSRQLFAYATNK